jgi:MYXO-CTERM domain-containing protein
LNTTIAGLGLTPGTYTYTWGTGGTANSLTINISGVPEPASLTMAATAAALIGGLAIRRRRRIEI